MIPLWKAISLAQYLGKVIKNKKHNKLKNQFIVLNTSMVGMTGLEPATSRPPGAYSTN